MKLGLHLAIAALFSSLTIMCTSSKQSDDGDAATAGTSGSQAGTSSGGNGNSNGGASSSGGSGDNTSGTSAGGASNGGAENGGTENGGAVSGGANGNPFDGGLDAGNDASSGGLSGPIATSGCSKPDPGEEPQTWIANTITVANLPADQVDHFGQRQYFVRLPEAYDHTRLYPIVFYGPGCGASGVESTPVMNSIKDDAIHVFLLQKDSCFSTGSFPSPEVPYFVQALDEVQAKYCTDASRVFVSGYSSGAWLANDLACAVGDRIRGIGTAAGGLQKAIIDGYPCPAGTAGIFYTGANDTTNPADRLDMNGFQIGVIGARDRLINSNGCDPNVSEPWQNTFGATDDCTIWKKGCESSPVVYCVGPGDGHGNGTAIHVSDVGWWEFWSALPEGPAN